MQLTTELVAEKQKVLIVAKTHYPFIDLLKKELTKYNLAVFLSPVTPSNLDRFDYCFFINTINIYHQPPKTSSKLVFIFYQSTNKTTITGYKSKTIVIVGDVVTKDHIDKILWFSLSTSGETFLSLNVPQKKAQPKINLRQPFTLHFHLSRKKIIATIIIFFIAFHLLFFVPLGIASFTAYKAVNALRSTDMNKAQRFLSIAKPALDFTKKWYSAVRPTYLLFSIALVPDSVIDVVDKTNLTLTDGLSLNDIGHHLADLMLKKDKTDEDKKTIDLLLTKLDRTLSDLTDNLTIIGQKVPPNFAPGQRLKSELSLTIDMVERVKKILPFANSLLAKNTTKKYLLLFANNMELRPGGGFIGSFGVLTVHDYTIDDLKLYDVYDADGQLKLHVDPPDPLRKYLGQPHFFLRDVAFYPDFSDTYTKAKFFLNEEMGLNNFSGALLLTTSGIQNLMKAFGQVYLPDFREKVDDKNFYLKAQIYAEDNFFPGSTKKKNFLGSLARTLMLELPTVSPKKLLQSVNQILDEKQLVVYMEDNKIQSVFDSLYWSGRLVEARCPPQYQNCVSDFLYPLEANVGVNKANFFITRSHDLKTSFDQTGKINHVFTLDMKNEAPDAVFPGGLYRNYLQVLLPKGAIVDKITNNGTLVDDFDQQEDTLKTVGFLVEIAPHDSAEIKVYYHLVQILQKGKDLYQLVVEKQIGLPTDDLTLHFSLPANLSIINQNFTPLVKNGDIIYNTYLGSDKIFFLELKQK